MKIVLNPINVMAAESVSKLFIIPIVVMLLFLSGCCSKPKKPGKVSVKKEKSNLKVTRLNKTKKKGVVSKNVAQIQTTFELPGQNGTIRIVDTGFSGVVEKLNEGEYKEAIEKIVNLKKKYPPFSPQGEALQYLHADSLFGHTDLDAAKQAYEKFLKDYPNSPLKENVEGA
ncbi:outer membrane protein assembly factor BamD, partial [bacterium]|nr:outer membrane protein assembly factor BamD [bacterium]